VLVVSELVSDIIVIFSRRGSSEEKFHESVKEKRIKYLISPMIDWLSEVIGMSVSATMSE